MLAPFSFATICYQHLYVYIYVKSDGGNCQSLYTNVPRARGEQYGKYLSCFFFFLSSFVCLFPSFFLPRRSICVFWGQKRHREVNLALGHVRLFFFFFSTANKPLSTSSSSGGPGHVKNPDLESGVRIKQKEKSVKHAEGRMRLGWCGVGSSSPPVRVFLPTFLTRGGEGEEKMAAGQLGVCWVQIVYIYIYRQ